VRRKESFQANASRLAQIVSGKDGITVSFGGDTAYTDGKHIVVPSLPAGTVMSDWEAKVYGGYLDHEAGHCRHTDFSDWKVKPSSKTASFLRMIFEDIFVENAQIGVYPGSRAYLDALAVYVDEKSAEEQFPDDPYSKALREVYKEAYLEYRKVDTNVIPGNLKEDYPEVAAAMKDLQNVRSTKDSIKIAEFVAQILVDYAPPPTGEDNEPGDGKDGGIPSISFGSPPPISEGDSKQGPPEAGGSDGGKSDDERKKEWKEGLEEAAAKLLKEFERQGAFQEMIEGMIEENQKLEGDWPEHLKGKPAKGGGGTRKGRRRHRRKSGQVVLPPGCLNQDKIGVKAKPKTGEFLRIRSSISVYATALKKMLNIYLQSRAKRGWHRGLEEGDLDEDALYSLSFSNRLSKQRRQAKRINTALHLVVDLSSSMNQELTAQTAILVAEAVANVREVKLKISGFKTTEIYSHYNDGNEKGVGRLSPMVMTTFKDFDEPYDRVKDKLGSLKTGGYTPLGDAYGYGMEQLLIRKELRKVLWLISDGSPQFAVGDRSHSDYLLMDRLYVKSKKLRIETMGLYVGHSGSSALENCTDKHVSVSTIQDLPTKIITILKGIMA